MQTGSTVTIIGSNNQVLGSAPVGSGGTFTIGISPSQTHGETISPDTIQDKVKPEIFYYRVFIRTHQDFLQNKLGRHFSIIPGMVATVDIKTGEKTIVDYLIKPFNRTKEALRER